MKNSVRGLLGGIVGFLLVLAVAITGSLTAILTHK